MNVEESDIESMKGSVKGIREKLEIERNGSDAFSVLKTYAIDYFDFYDLK